MQASIASSVKLHKASLRRALDVLGQATLLNGLEELLFVGLVVEHGSADDLEASIGVERANAGRGLDKYVLPFPGTDAADDPDDLCSRSVDGRGLFSAGLRAETGQIDP